MELPIEFVYCENGKPAGSLAEHKRMQEIAEWNKKLQKDCNEKIKEKYDKVNEL